MVHYCLILLYCSPILFIVLQLCDFSLDVITDLTYVSVVSLVLRKESAAICGAACLAAPEVCLGSILTSLSVFLLFAHVGFHLHPIVVGRLIGH